MAKTPGTPKAKTAAPAQFDMNSRERKGGGKGGFGGQGRGQSEKRPPAHIVTLPAVTVDKGEGWTIQKVGKIDQASHVAVGAEYRLTFEGRDPMVFDYLGAARERAKEGPPEPPPEPEPTPEPVKAEAEAGEAMVSEGGPVGEGEHAHEGEQAAATAADHPPAEHS